MKGTVVSSWITSSRNLFGNKIVDEALRKFGFSSSQIFSPLEDVPDSAACGLVEHIGAKAGKSKEEIWGIMGRENIKTFSENYPGFFRQESAFQFLKSMNDVHKIVMRRFRGAAPPVLDMTVISSCEAMFVYRSKRGMGDYLRGLLAGVAAFFGEKIEIRTEKSSGSEIHIRLIFEKEIAYTKKYFLNRLLSFGFIKNSGIKAALLTGFAAAVPIFALWGVDARTLGLALGVPLLAAASNMLLAMPMKAVRGEIAQLSERQFTAKLSVRSSDEFEAIIRDIRDIKSVVQKDFLGFNSNMDEMHTFNSSLSGISGNMMNTSDDIIGIIEQVANATTQQANNTEQLVSVLNDSIQSIGMISDESRANNDRIVEAVNGLERSFGDVRSTSDQIQRVMQQFSDIRRSGNQLQSDAEKITEIVSIVSGIASQINLLALNASIEASRAGEAGRGFSVVADEVRKLSVETNQAVEQIKGELSGFIGEITNLVGDIDRQYGVLGEGSSSLNSAVEMSNLSNENLKEVSRLMTGTTDRLQNEARSISGLFDSIQNLAAIAQENSASTQTASECVSDYIVQITELSRQISVFNSLIEDFKNGLSDYKI